MSQRVLLSTDAKVTDLDDMTGSGLYSVQIASGTAHAPAQIGWCTCLVNRVNGNVGYVTQLIQSLVGDVYVRGKNDAQGGWTSWKKLS